MAEENKQAEEEIEEPVVNLIFYGPQFLYEILYKHKKELGLPENFKIGSGKKFKDVLYALRLNAYNQFKTTYQTPHLNQPKMEVKEAYKDVEPLRDIIIDKKDKIWELMENDETLRTYNYGGKPKIKISNKKDFDNLLKTPNIFIKVITHDKIYNIKRTQQNIKDLEADLKYFEKNNAEIKKNLVQNEILKGNETDEEINNKLKEINKRLQKLRPKNKTEEENKEYNLLEDAKDKIKDIQQNKKYIEKDKIEINQAYEYKKSIEKELEEEKGKIEEAYNGKLQTIEEKYKKEIEKIKENIELTAKDKENKIKELEETHKVEIEKLKTEKEKIEEEKENVIKEQEEEIDTKRNMLAHANAKRLEAEVEKKQLKEELKAKNEQPKPTYQPSNTPPTLKDYIRDKVINKSYSLEKDELIKVIEKDIDEHRLPKDIDVSKLADTIYLQGAKYINKHMKKIKSLAKLTGYDNDLYNKLPSKVADEIQKYIHDKALEDIRKKNIRYILPKEMPRWEKAVNKGINPMLGRGAWSK